MTAATPPPMWTVTQTAEYLSVAVETLRHWIKHDTAPPSYKVGHARRFVGDEVIAWSRVNRSGAA
jgi:excisionase family DNA binding protein